MPRSSFSMANTTKGRLPRLPFSRLKDAVLGKEYALSLVFIENAKAEALNRKYRGKQEPANILAFPLSSSEGEIFIAPGKVKKDAPRFAMQYRRFLLYIFIHGLLHLKGLRHGSTMEAREAQLLIEYKI